MSIIECKITFNSNQKTLIFIYILINYKQILKINASVVIVNH